MVVAVVMMILVGVIAEVLTAGGLTAAQSC